MEVSINISDKELANKSPINSRNKNGRRTGRRKGVLVALTLLLVLFLTGGLYLLYKGYKVTSEIGFQFTPGSILQPKKDPELQKDSTGKYTNILLVGIDTREKGNLQNTDSIIVASYNHETKDTVMISIPRDFHVQVSPTRVWFNRINSVYAVHENREKGSGLPALQRVVEDLTDMEIQYYAMVNYNGFVELIDAVGGIYVNVENTFTDYRYPKGTGYQTVRFQAGPQLMDGETALKYSRSRHSMQHGEGSDFARARRQQRVLMAFKDLLLSSETLLNPKKIMDLMSAVQNNLKISDFTLDEIQAGVNIFKGIKDAQSNTYSFVLDPSSANSTIITSNNVVNTGAYAVGPIAGLGKYDDIQDYVKLLIKNPQLYTENPSIYVYNTGLGYQDTYNKVQRMKKEFKYINIRFLGNLSSNQEGIYIFSNKENEFDYSVGQLSKYLKSSNKQKPEFVTTNLRGEDITILFGKEVNTDNSQ
jgi:polyisoprenyl-teichoic acid--peptidoglycan teichoic acid transferase